MNQLTKETKLCAPRIFVPVLALLTFFSKPVYCCGLCSFGFFDYYLPPVLFYCHLISFWILCLGMFAAIKKKKVLKQNPFILSILAVLLSYIVGFASFGPVGYLFVLYGSFIFIYKNISKEERKPLTFINTFFVAGVVVLTIYGQYIRTQRTPADFILEWNGTVPSRYMIKNLAKTPGTGLPQLRYILKNGESSALHSSAQVMVGIAEPEKDIPLFLDALKRARQRKDRDWVIEQLEESIIKISGIEMPNNFAIEEFEKKWQEKNKISQAPHHSFPP